MRSSMPSGIDLLKMLLTLVVSNDMVDGSEDGDNGGGEEEKEFCCLGW